MSESPHKNPLMQLLEKIILLSKRYKYAILFIGLIGGAMGYYWGSIQPKEFVAVRKFVVNEEEAGGFGGSLNSILTQFGMSSGASGGVNLDRILEIGKSKRLVYSVLMDSTDSDIIANELLGLYNLESNEYDTLDFQNFQFAARHVKDDSLIQQVARKLLYEKLVGDGPGSDPILSIQSNDLTGVLSIKTQTVREDLCTILNERMFELISDYYITRTIEPQQATYNYLTSKVDSLRRRIGYLEQRLGINSDSQRGTFSKRFDIEKQSITREISATSMAYAKAVENQAIADYSLQSQRPFFQVIDEPILPLESVETNEISTALLGLILGIFSAIGVLTAQVFIQEVRDLPK